MAESGKYNPKFLTSEGVSVDRKLRPPKSLILVAFAALAGALLIYSGLTTTAILLFQPRLHFLTHYSYAYSYLSLQQFIALTWLPRSEFQTGVSLCAIAVLLIPLSFKLRTPGVLRMRLVVGERAKSALLVLMVVGLAGFAIFAAYVDLWNFLSPQHLFFQLFNDKSFPGGNWFGVPAAAFILVAALASAVMWSGEGAGRSVLKTLTLVVSPASFLYSLGLLVFKPSQMTWHVTNFLPLGVMPTSSGLAIGYFPIPYHPSYDNGIDLLSNWSVLIISGFLICVGLLELRINPLSKVALWLRARTRGNGPAS